MNKDDIKKQELEAVKEQDLENVNGGAILDGNTPILVQSDAY